MVGVRSRETQFDEEKGVREFIDGVCVLGVNGGGVAEFRQVVPAFFPVLLRGEIECQVAA